jgi:protein TonB
MSQSVTQTGGSVARIGELALWAAAGLLVLAVHIAAAALLLQEAPSAPADNAPPAAIMIELAPEPQAANTEEEQIAPDAADIEEVKSDQMQPVEEAQPEPEPQPVAEPTPEPVEPPPPPQEVAEAPEPTPPEPTPPEPTPEPVQEPPQETLPTPEITQTIPEPPPEPIKEPDRIEEQMTAALENVEVPLPVMRPAPPPKLVVAEKPDPRKEQEKVERRKQKQQQAQKEMAQAKLETKQADRTAASQTSTGSVFSSSVSPAKWMTRVRAKIARYARRCPGNGTGVVTVRFSFDGGGNIGNVSVTRSSGDPAIDDYVASAVRRASPIPAPPSGVATSLSQPVQCE